MAFNNRSYKRLCAGERNGGGAGRTDRNRQRRRVTDTHRVITGSSLSFAPRVYDYCVTGYKNSCAAAVAQWSVITHNNIIYYYYY